MPTEVYERQRERMKSRLDAMSRFVFDSSECRVRGMLRYFGEKDAGECGKCDVCRSKRITRPSAESIRESILYQASHPGGSDIHSLLANAPGQREEIIAEIRSLADSGEIVIDGEKVTKRQ